MGRHRIAGEWRGWMKPRAVSAFVLALISCLVGGGARAHQDPPNCTAPAISIVFQAVRADRVTAISTVENVSECETGHAQASDWSNRR